MGRSRNLRSKNESSFLEQVKNCMDLLHRDVKLMMLRVEELQASPFYSSWLSTSWEPLCGHIHPREPEFVSGGSEQSWNILASEFVPALQPPLSREAILSYRHCAPSVDCSLCVCVQEEIDIDAEVLGWTEAAQADFEQEDDLTKHLACCTRPSQCIPEIKAWLAKYSCRAEPHSPSATVTGDPVPEQSETNKLDATPLPHQRHYDEEKWALLEEPLETCIKHMRGQFPLIYERLLEDEREATGDASLHFFPIARKDEIMEQILQVVMTGLHKSLRSDPARDVLANLAERVEAYIRSGIVQMFQMVETHSVESAPAAAAGPFRLRGITQRGMAQPRRKR